VAGTLRTVLVHRQIASAVVATAIWTFASTRYPFPENEPYPVLLQEVRPHIYNTIRLTYTLLWFTTPLLAASSLLSLAYSFLVGQGRSVASPKLPRYPDPATSRDLSVVIGEIHRTQHVEPVPRPTWLPISARGLFTGIAIFGAVGSGKTSGCMHPFAEQILAFRRNDSERRPGALVLAVKGDFCHRIREILERHGRGDDHVEISLSCEYRYNPLHNDLEVYAPAYGIASSTTNPVERNSLLEQIFDEEQRLILRATGPDRATGEERSELVTTTALQESLATDQLFIEYSPARARKDAARKNRASGVES